MAHSVLFTFDTKESKDQFMASYAKLIKKAAASKATAVDGLVLSKAVENITHNPELQQEGQRATAVFVSGKKIFEGTLKDCRKRFAYEIGSHSGTVELKEMREKDWVTINSRKYQ
jgi:hypothetical protein